MTRSATAKEAPVAPRAAPAAVSDAQLAATARFLDRIGAPLLANGYFPPDTRHLEVGLLLLGGAAWVAGFGTVFGVVSYFGTSAYGEHFKDWLLLLAICLIVGVGSFLWRDELRTARMGQRPANNGRLRLILRGSEFVLWIMAIALMIVALSNQPGDPGSIALLALLVAGMTSRFAIRRFTGRNLVTASLSTVRSGLDGLRESTRLASTVPLMLGVVAFLFLTSDAWRLFGRMEPWRFLVVFLALVAAIAIGLKTRLPNPWLEVETWKPAEIEKLASETPAKTLVEAGVEPALVVLSRIDRRTRMSLLAPLWLGRMVRILAAAVALIVILLVIGLIAIGRSQTHDLTGDSTSQMVPLRFLGVELVLSDSLVKVAVLLSMLGAAYFAVVSLADAATKEQFLRSEATPRLHYALAAWAYFKGAIFERRPYLTLRGEPVYHADLSGVDLRGADLSTQDLSEVNLKGALADGTTKWPAGYDPAAHGVQVQRWWVLRRTFS